MPQPPDFRDPAFLDAHIRHTMAFYHPRCIDRAARRLLPLLPGRRHRLRRRHPPPGQQHPLRLQLRDGVPPVRRRGLPGRRRATAWRSCATPTATRPPAAMPGCSGAGNAVLDGTNHCYGLAFVVLAYAKALEAGIAEARGHLDETWQLMERHFWSEADGLYRDEISADWPRVSPYRGQNANMHSCEAMLAAFEATGEPSYLDRAERLARRVTIDLAGKADGLVWEHYDAELERRLGLQPGRPQAPVPPLGLPARPPDRMGQAAADPGAAPPGRLAAADRPPPVRHRPAARLGRRAWRHLLRLRPRRHRSATATSISGSRPRASPPRRCSPRAPARSATGTGTTGSGTIPGATWSTTSTAPGSGSSTSATTSTSDEKSPAGKTDYHTMGACYEVLNVVR